MSGIGMTLNIAATALLAQKYGMDVTAHNIANVNTPGYSRQNPVYSAKIPILHRGLIIGRGVDTKEIVRSYDQFVENQLMQKRSGMLSSQELESYMKILEGLFNEDAETGMGSLLADFWSLWHDISNNPSGAPERIAILEHSKLLSRRLLDLDAELTRIQEDLTSSISAGVVRINEITSHIATLNRLIVEMGGSRSVNDIMDQRNTLVSELSGYMDIKTFEQENGSITIISARGCILVQGNSSYDLQMGGSNGDRVQWQGSNGSTVDITNYISGGRLSGWLDMRDEILTKYMLDLDAMSKEFIWSVNRQHSQGVGLKLFQPGTTITGTYQTVANRLDTLSFGDRIQFIQDSFNLWVEDRTDPDNPRINSVSIDLSGLDIDSKLSNLADSINKQISASGLTGVVVNGSGAAIKFTALNDYAFGFSDDASGILAALGVNTFFHGSGAGSIGVNGVLTDTDYIAAGRIGTAGEYTKGDNTNSMALADLQYRLVEISQWTCDRADGNKEGSVSTTIESYYHALVGSTGIASRAVSRRRIFCETMVNKLTEVRDSISAVSLDEEMANLIRFQHAYSAAAKLISVSDEMMDNLLNLK
ncbi:MAG: flagellar hook-associated protein FlgK [Deltaproteobacteria bacterium]|nr:flagellar hook-associated protein FlgK [Deltaproteobacteria bacterium]